MIGRQRLWLVAAAAALAATAAGCLARTTPPSPRPKPEQSASTASMNPGDEISRLVKDRMKDARNVDTIVVGNVAVVGVDKGLTARPTAPQAPQPGGGAPTPGAPGVAPGTPPTAPPPSGARPGTPPPPGATAPLPRMAPGVSPDTTPPTKTEGAPLPPTTMAPPPDRIDVLPASLRDEIMRRFPQIVRVHSTDDPNLVPRIASIARDIRNRRQVADRANEMAHLVFMTSTDRTIPPARNATPARRGVPDRNMAPGAPAPAPAR